MYVGAFSASISLRTLSKTCRDLLRLETAARSLNYRTNIIVITYTIAFAIILLPSPYIIVVVVVDTYLRATHNDIIMHTRQPP